MKAQKVVSIRPLLAWLALLLLLATLQIAAIRS